MKCNNCGEFLEENSLFCKNCGTPVNKNNLQQNQDSIQTNYNNSSINNQNFQQQNYNNNNNNNNKIIITVLLAIVGTIIFIFGISIIIKQVKLHIVERKVAEEAEKLRDSSDFQKKETRKQKNYKIGDKVTLVDGSSWHILSISNDNVVLLSDTTTGDKIGYGSTGSVENQTYENSNVKTYIEQTYLPNLKSSISKNNGDSTNVTARLITVTEALNFTGQKLDENMEYRYSKYLDDRTNLQRKNEKTLALTDSFWTMNNIMEVNPTTRFYGAYFINVVDDNAWIYSDIYAQKNSISGNGTLLYIRPVIETTVDNLK